MRRVLQATMLTFLLAVCAPHLGQARDAQGWFNVAGSGVQGCTDYLAAVSTKQSLLFDIWITGYLTAYNEREEGTYNILGTRKSQAAFDWIMAYCHVNPTKKFHDAAEALIKAFYPTRATEAPPVVLPPAPPSVTKITQPPSPPGGVLRYQGPDGRLYFTQLPVSAPVSSSPRQVLIHQVQQRLQAQGFSPGAIDGAMGPQTRDALRWFQNAKGLPSTGEPDEQTLDALGVR